MLMKKEDYEELMREQNKNLQEQGVSLNTPVCPYCGEKMVNDIDSKTKEVSKYLWKTKCGHMEKFRLARG